MHQADLETVVTGRSNSEFKSDIESRRRELNDAIRGKRILVVGGGGSIGSSTTSLLVDFAPSTLDVIDQSENYLADLVRDLRGRPDGIGNVELRTFPIDYGSRITERFLMEAEPFDIVLNFAAIKHVRSEKDVYSLLQMIDTNIVKHVRFKNWLKKFSHGKSYFAVSTDKAANPTSLMGATKRLMEDLVFEMGVPVGASTTSARFANVAFSNGSILQAFGRRLELRQPLAVPRDTRRYFVSKKESAEICLLAAFIAPDRHIVYPRMDPELNLQLLQEIAVRFLTHHGFEAKFFDDEKSAFESVGSLAERRQWPVLLTPLDTSGEKPYEEFVGLGEMPAEIGLASILAISHVTTGRMDEALLDKLDNLVSLPEASASKNDIVDTISRILPNFNHVETGKNLDQRF